MIERSYLCDLCKDKYPLAVLTPIVWKGSGWEVGAQDSEHHICDKCIRSIKRLESTG